VPASEKSGDNNLSVSGVYSDYDATPVDFADYAETFSKVMLLAKSKKATIQMAIPQANQSPLA
jgi:hypothetical protein